MVKFTKGGIVKEEKKGEKEAHKESDEMAGEEKVTTNQVGQLDWVT